LTKQPISRRAFLAAFVAGVAFALVSALALVSYLNMESRTFDQAADHTGRVSRSEAAVVHYWLDERASDIAIMGDVSRVRTEFAKYVAGDENAKAWLVDRLETERVTRGYTNVSLFTPDGKRALSFGAASPTSDADVSVTAAAVAAPTASTVVTSRLAPSGSYLVNWFAPLIVREQGKEPTVAGVIMYEADLRTYLLRVIQPEQAPWPTVIEVRVSGAEGAFVARSSNAFLFEPANGDVEPETAVVKSTKALSLRGASVSAEVREDDIKDGLAWARQSTRLADVLVLVVFSLFVWAYARAERNRLMEIEGRTTVTDALATQDRFLANMSHELRTPLNSIIGFSSLMQRGLAGPVNEEQCRQLAMIESSGRHLLTLVTDVLDLSKTKAGNEEVRPEWIVASEPVEFVTDMLASAVAEKRLTWSVNVPANLELRTDRRLLERTLLNLATNAVKFTHEGHVTITVAAVTPNDEVAFTVRDSGRGITAESLDVIMQEFRQVAIPGLLEPEGLGLGLSICNTTAKLLGGRIDVESTPGVGSAFTLVLPRNAGVVL